MATGHDLAMRLRRAYLAMHRRTNATTGALGLTADQFVLLTTLVEVGRITQAELVKRTGSDPNTVSEMLRLLERRELVTRERDADDGRVKLVTLTRRGRQVQKRLWEVTDAIRVQLERALPAAQLESVVEALDKLVDAMSAAAEADEAAPKQPRAKRVRVRQR